MVNYLKKNIYRCVKQGDPLSPLLYNFSIDPLLTNLNMELRGIPINNKIKLKSIAFADDIVLGIKNSLDLEDFWFIYNKYSKASNACLNWDKTEVIKINKNSTKNYFKQTPNSIVRHLGIIMDNNGINKSLTIDILLNKINKRINYYIQRNLSISGKILVINSCILPLIYYSAKTLIWSNNYIKNIEK